MLSLLAFAFILAPNKFIFNYNLNICKQVNTSNLLIVKSLSAFFDSHNKKTIDALLCSETVKSIAFIHAETSFLLIYVQSLSASTNFFASVSLRAAKAGITLHLKISICQYRQTICKVIKLFHRSQLHPFLFLLLIHLKLVHQPVQYQTSEENVFFSLTFQ